MQKEFGVKYLNRLRAAYPEIPGRADFCGYWFYKAHQHLKPGSFAGLVGTNTIHQNYSREALTPLMHQKIHQSSWDTNTNTGHGRHFEILTLQGKSEK